MSVSQIMALEFRPPEVSEDCLYLNVYTPAQAKKGDKLPVCPLLRTPLCLNVVNLITFQKDGSQT